MTSDALTGVERAFFGPVRPADVDHWLGGVVEDRLAADLRGVLFRAGRIDAVYGLRLGDDREVVLKVHRPPVDVSALEAKRVALRYLASTGYPCPDPIDGPVMRDGHVVTVETLLRRGASADACLPELRRALARSLVEHVHILRGVKHLAPLVGAGPAWTRYSAGPWPMPHDPVFDFSSTPVGWTWLDAFARKAADELMLLRGGEELIIGHGDWYAGNVHFEDQRVVAAFDWDLMTESEAVLAGLSAGGHLANGAPTSEEVAGFLADVDDARDGTFTTKQRHVASAAARWVLAFNARCDLSNLGNQAELGDEEIPETSALARLWHCRDAYEHLTW